jgi:hypothetical protein
MSSESHDLFCPKCNILVSARVIASGHGGFSSAALNPEDVPDAEYHGDSYSVALCGRCSSPFLLKESRYGVPGEFETITESQLLFPSESRLPLEGVPEPVRRAYEQASRSFGASLYEPCALMCRRCLEGVCKVQGASGSNLNAKLESLEKSGAIDARMVRWAHGIRLLGNDAAHDLDTVISQEDARDVLDFTEALLIYIFALNHRFAAFSARRNKQS